MEKKKTDLEVIQTKDSLEMIIRDYLWPRKTILTLAKGSEELGIIFFMDKTTVILANIYFYDLMTNGEKLNLEKIKYSSIKSLLADGWIVD